MRVNAVAPGLTLTPMMDRFTGNTADAKTAFLSLIPGGRAGTPEAVAQTLLAPGLRQGGVHRGAVVERGWGYDDVGGAGAPR